MKYASQLCHPPALGPYGKAECVKHELVARLIKIDLHAKPRSVHKHAGTPSGRQGNGHTVSINETHGGGELEQLAPFSPVSLKETNRLATLERGVGILKPVDVDDILIKRVVI